MRLAIFLALLSSAATSAEAAEPSQVIVATERTPFAFILNTPTGAIANASSSDIIRIVDDLLRRDTSLAPQLIESDVVGACQGVLTCLVLAARQDYKRDALRLGDGTPIPYREHVRRLRKAGTSYARYLFVLSNVTVPGKADRMTALLVDTDLALEIYHAADDTKPNWKDDVEARIATRAVPVEQIRAEVRDAGAAREFLERTLTGSYVEAFESSGHWRPYGTVDLVTHIGGVEITVDDQAVGSTVEGVTRITKLLPGTRALVLRHPAYGVLTTVASVRRGEVVTVEPKLELLPSESISTERDIVLYSGLGLAAVGAAVVAYAIATTAGGPRGLCFESPCTGEGFSTLRYDPSRRLDQVDEVNQGGVLVAPLGAALFGAGASFSLGVLLSRDDTSPWWFVLLGTAVGGAVYGLSAITN